MVFILAIVCISSLVLYFDFLYYRIPNFIPVLILSLYLVKSLTIGFDNNIMSFILTFLISCALGLFLVYKGFIGGGDAKMIIALIPWAYEMDLRLFLLYTTCVGALIAILYLIPVVVQKIQLLRWKIISCVSPTFSKTAFLALGQQQTARGTKYGIPYGVAVFSGFLLLVIHKYGAGK